MDGAVGVGVAGNAEVRVLQVMLWWLAWCWPWACPSVVGGSGCRGAWRALVVGWWSVGLWSWWSLSSLVLG